MIQFQVREPPGPRKMYFLGNITSNMDSLANESSKKHKASRNAAFLPSLDPIINESQINKEVKDTSKVYPIFNLENELQSLVLGADEPDPRSKNGILLIDDKEELRIKSEAIFLKALNLEPGKRVKVVSIFGNTGEGKSYTLNKVFFNGEEVFKTSSSQISCTLGVWAKYDPNLNVICLDTEGLLGITKRENQRTRLLLKILAVSDVIIYRTRAERLPKDLYTFLGGASEVYKKHFSSALQKVLARSEGDRINTGLGPGVIIFHETHHTNTLHDIHDKPDVTQSAEDILRENFNHLNLNCDAFSFFTYVGVKTSGDSQTSFDRLKSEVHRQLESSEVRSPRDAKYIYLMLRSLNEKFQSSINDNNPQNYLTQFFTCPDKCQSCNSNCTLSMGHKEDGEPHKCDTPCQFQHQYQNSVFLCKRCIKNGERMIVKPTYQTTKDNSWTSYLNFVWSGYVIECPKCGEIYRSWKHWYGNKNPEECSVQLEIVHMWPGERMLFGIHNSAQKVVDGVSVITDAVSSVSAPPAKMLTDWVNDRLIAPSYWRPNSEITSCTSCNVSFVPGNQNRIVPSKHHCRSCGEGFCESCSSKRCPVPQKGWTDPVRVCDNCYGELEGRGDSLLVGISQEKQSTEVRARYISETIVSSISAVKSVLDIPKDLIKETARPSYWTPDNECTECVLCRQPFGVLTLHHCRDCGKGVCDNCSKSRKPVPFRGWDSPVRVCDACR